MKLDINYGFGRIVLLVASALTAFVIVTPAFSDAMQPYGMLSVSPTESSASGTTTDRLGFIIVLFADYGPVYVKLSVDSETNWPVPVEFAINATESTTSNGTVYTTSYSCTNTANMYLDGPEDECRIYINITCPKAGDWKLVLALQGYDGQDAPIGEKETYTYNVHITGSSGGSGGSGSNGTGNTTTKPKSTPTAGIIVVVGAIAFIAFFAAYDRRRE